jgi:hypothetical protein
VSDYLKIDKDKSDEFVTFLCKVDEVSGFFLDQNNISSEIIENWDKPKSELIIKNKHLCLAQSIFDSLEYIYELFLIEGKSAYIGFPIFTVKFIRSIANSLSPLNGLDFCLYSFLMRRKLSQFETFTMSEFESWLPDKMKQCKVDTTVSKCEYRDCDLNDRKCKYDKETELSNDLKLMVDRKFLKQYNENYKINIL